MTVKQCFLSLISSLAIVLVIAILTLVGWVSWLVPWAHQPLDFTDTPLLKVESGFGVQRVANILRARGHLSQDSAAVWYARLTQQTAIKRGHYQLDSGLSWAQVIQRLHTGQVAKYSVTFVEGWRWSQILSHLQSQPYIEKTLDVEREWFVDPDSDDMALKPRTSPDWLQSLSYFPSSKAAGQPIPVEGLFYASTYHYTAGDSDRAVLLRANRRLKEELDRLWPQRTPDLPYSSPYQALIMASIVEKETGVAVERPRIAGVFVRRLRKNMRLQTDPTVIYGLGASFDGDLTRKHLKTPTPYNTYIIKGLPPTPIASAGQAALEAALKPNLEDDALYFVGKGDGTHYFSSSLSEHNRAVQRYQVRQRVQNYRSSPAKSGVK